MRGTNVKLRRGFVLALLSIGFVVGLSATASAQDAPSVSVDPLSVDAPGEVEVTVTGSGWSGVDNGVVFLYSCVVPESGDAADITLPCDPVEDLVDNGANVNDEGTFENTFAFAVPGEGLCVAGASPICRVGTPSSGVIELALTDGSHLYAVGAPQLSSRTLMVSTCCWNSASLPSAMVHTWAIFTRAGSPELLCFQL